MQTDQYKVSYVYNNPSSAGPFKGKQIMNYKPEKGDSIRAIFGSATVISVSKVKNR